MAEKEFFKELKTEFKELGNKVNKMFDEFMHGNRGKGPYSPTVDVYETSEHLVYELDLPGFDKDSIVAQVREHRLVVRGQRNPHAEREGSKFLHQEREFGAFEREFPLPSNVDAEDIRAQYQNGVLRVIMPRTSDEPVEAQINIE